MWENVDETDHLDGENVGKVTFGVFDLFFFKVLASDKASHECAVIKAIKWINLP